MRYPLFIVLSAALTTEAAAQQTNCRWVGSTWTCNTVAPPAPPAPLSSPDFNVMMGAMRAGQQDRQREQQILAEQQRLQAEQDRLAAQQRSDDEARALRLKVGKLVAEGDCKGAEAAALIGGNLILAGQVNQYCSAANVAPADPPKPPQHP